MQTDSNKTQEAPDALLARLRSKLFQQAAKILAIFALPAIIGMLIGYIIDHLVGIAPWGTVFVLLVMFCVSWWFTIKTIKELNN